jgi:hypothetical protein
MSVFTSKSVEEVAEQNKAYEDAWNIVNNYKNNETTLVEIIKNLIIAAKENN